MNPHSPGKPAWMNLAFKFNLLTLFAALHLFTGIAPAQEQDRASGVAEPKVSVLMPKVVSHNPKMLDYNLPTRFSIPTGIAVDSKDRIWISLISAHSIGVLNPETNQYKEYRIPSTVDLPTVDWEYDPMNREIPETSPLLTNYSVGAPASLIVDKNDVVWFVTQMGNSIARFDPVKEEFTEFMIPTKNALPYDLAADSRGRIWFVEKNMGKIGWLDVEKEKMYELQLPERSSITGIAVDSNDKIWISETFGNYIGRYDPDTKKFKKFPITTDHALPGQLRFDSQGRLWVVLTTAKQIGVLMMDAEKGIFAVQDMPGYNAVPRGLAVGKDDLIWVVDNMMNRVGYFDPVKLKWNLFNIPHPNTQPLNIAADSKGDLWYTQGDKSANRITKIVRSTVPMEDKAVAEADRESIAAGKALAQKGFSGKFVALIVVAVLAIIFAGLAVRTLRKKS